MQSFNCFHIFILLALVRCQHPGEPCVLQSTRQSGICSTLQDCPELLNKYQMGENYLQNYTFQRNHTLVCCPKLPAKPGEISQQKCKKYAILSKSFDENPKRVLRQIQRTFKKPLLHNFIIGGQNATQGEFPHMALIGYETPGGGVVWSCAGSIISELFVITAAHCLKTRDLGEAKYVKVGILNQTTDTKVQTIKIAECIKHPQYTIASHYDDIGLLKLVKPICFDKNTQPACLYAKDEVIFFGIATGWGKTNYTGEGSEILQKVGLNIFAGSDCNKSYKNVRKLKNGIDPNKQICAGSFAGEEKDTCQGDSGGPLQRSELVDKEDVVSKWFIVGVTAFGRMCGIQGIPGVYTRVASYIPWIEETVWN